MKIFSLTILGLCVLGCAFADDVSAPPVETAPITIATISPDSTSTAPSGSGKLVEPPKPSSLPEVESKLQTLLFELIEGVDMKLSMEMDRGVVSLTTIHNLGLHIHAHPFTAEENEKLKPFREYMSMIYAAREKLNSQIASFSNSRFFEYSGFPDHHLSEQQKEKLNELIDKTAAGVGAASKAIDEILSNNESQELIKNIEDGKKEVTTQLQRLTLALQVIDSKLIDEAKLLSVKNEAVQKVSDTCKGLLGRISSPAMIKFISELNEPIEKIIALMKDLPLKVDLSYMD